jgi:hypothetical protein
MPQYCGVATDVQDPETGARPAGDPAGPGVRTIDLDEVEQLLDAVLARGQSVRFRARGFSMRPVIQDHDVVTVSPLGGAIPCAGDMVACRHPATRRLVVHRVRAARPDGWLVQGDNVLDPDGVVPAADLIGLVTRVERDGAEVYRFTPGRPSAIRRLTWLARLSLRAARGLARRLKTVVVSRGR